MCISQCQDALTAKKLNDSYDRTKQSNGGHLNQMELEPALIAASNSEQSKGLKNLGNTCYFNATLQDLFRHPRYCELSLDDTNQCNNSQIARAFVQLKTTMTYTNLFELYRLCMNLSQNRFAFHRQEDMREFRIWMLDQLSRDNQQDNEYYKLKLQDVLSKQESGHLYSKYGKSTYEHSIELEIIETSITSVQTALDHSCRCEKLQKSTELDLADENGGQYTHIEKRIDNLPHEINIGLKRFNYRFDVIPIQKIRLSKEITVNPSINVNGQQYYLKSIVIHSSFGSNGENGHYYYYVKENGHWSKYDDSNVSTVSEDTVFEDSKINAYSITYTKQHEAISSDGIDEFSNLTILAEAAQSSSNDQTVESTGNGIDEFSNLTILAEAAQSSSNDQTVESTGNGVDEFSNLTILAEAAQSSSNDQTVESTGNGVDEFSNLTILAEAAQSSSNDQTVESTGNGVESQALRYDKTAGISYLLLGGDPENLLQMRTFDLNDTAASNSEKLKLIIERDDQIDSVILKEFLQTFGRVLFSDQLDDVIQIVISQSHNDAIPYLLMNGCGTGKSIVILASSILLAKLKKKVTVFVPNQMLLKPLNDQYTFLMRESNYTLTEAEKDYIVFNTHEELKKTCLQSDSNTEEGQPQDSKFYGNVVIIDEAHKIAGNIFDWLNKQGANIVFSSATIVAENIKDGFKGQENLYKVLDSSQYSSVIKQLEFRRFMTENIQMSSKRFALDLRSIEKDIYLAQGNTGDLAMNPTDLVAFHNAREALWNIRKNTKLFFGDDRLHISIIELLDKIEVTFKFKAVCETFQNLYSQNDLTHFAIHLSHYKHTNLLDVIKESIESKLNELTNKTTTSSALRIPESGQKKEENKTKVNIGKEMLIAIESLKRMNVLNLDLSTKEKVLNELKKHGVTLTKNQVGFNPNEWGDDVRLVLLTDKSSCGINLDGFWTHLARKSDDSLTFATETQRRELDARVYDIQSAIRGSDRFQFKYRFFRASTQATLEDVMRCFHLINVSMYEWEHKKVHQADLDQRFAVLSGLKEVVWGSFKLFKRLKDFKLRI